MVGDEVRMLLEHWQIALLATPGGFAMGTAILAAIYLAPWVRLRLAADHVGRSRVLGEERRRQARLEDAAAVYGEHGRPEARELRLEIELRGRLLRKMEREAAHFEERG